MKKVMSLITGLLVLLPLCMAASADVSVDIRLDRREATTADTVTMTVSLSGARKADSRPVIEGMDPFDMKSGGTSTRVEIINGRVRSGVEFTYFIRADYGLYKKVR